MNFIVALRNKIQFLSHKSLVFLPVRVRLTNTKIFELMNRAPALFTKVVKNSTSIVFNVNFSLLADGWKFFSAEISQAFALPLSWIR